MGHHPMKKAGKGRKVPYRFGLPTKYSDPKQGREIDATVEEDVKNKKDMSEAYKEGRRIPLSAFKRRVQAKKGAKVKAKPLSAATIKVYRRGQGAWLSSGSRRGASMAAWAMGRVNSYIRGSKKHDTDLRRG
jgi:hypothetical protein